MNTTGNNNVTMPKCIKTHVLNMLDNINYGYSIFWENRQYPWPESLIKVGLPKLLSVRIIYPTDGNRVHVRRGSTRTCSLYGSFDDEQEYKIGDVPWPQDGVFVIRGSEKIIPMRESTQIEYPIVFDDFIDIRNRGIRLYTNGKSTIAYHRRIHKVDTADILDILSCTKPLGKRKMDDIEKQEKADEAAERIGKAAKMRTVHAQRRFGYSLIMNRIDISTFRMCLDGIDRLKNGIDVAHVRDDMTFRSIETSSVLFDTLFRIKWNRRIKCLEKDCMKNPNISLSAGFENVFGLSNDLILSLASGRWEFQQGMTQQVQSTSELSRLAQHVRVSSVNIRPENKCIGPRMLHMSTVGYYCINDTPEGQSTGLTKSLTLLSRVVPKSVNTVQLSETFKVCLMTEACRRISTKTTGNCRCVVDGIVITEGWTNEDIQHFVNILRNNRRSGELPGGSWKLHASIAVQLSTGNLEIRTYGGRVVRPLVPVDKWEEFINRTEQIDNCPNIVEWIDANEERMLHVTPFASDIEPTTTHIEPYVPGILSIASSTAIMSDHNQSPRNVYQASMCRQAVCGPTTKTVQRGRYMWYGQKPLIDTHAMQCFSERIGPTGGNAIVLFHSMAYNQEDSIVFNRSSIELGFMRTVRTREYVVVIDNDMEVELVPMGSILESNGIILRTRKQTLRHSGTTGARLNEHIIQQTEMGTRHILRFIEQRKPEIGNKFASRSAQKATIGITLAREDLPFTRNGIVPDMIINPHCLPSRMTISHLFEAAWGRECAISGTFGDGTTFGDMPIHDVHSGLRQHGMSWNEQFINPQTGHPMTNMYVGIIHYQVLTHFAREKANARGTGPENALTCQPCAGGANGGGQRCGEMERDVLASHGATSVLLDRLLHCSDKYETQMCRNCGRLGTLRANGECTCSAHLSQSVGTVRIPYAAKLLLQELQGMSISTELKT